MKLNIPFPVYSSIKQHSVALKTPTARVIMRHSGKMKECPQSPSSPAGLIHWLLFVRTFWTFYMNSDSCCAKAGGSVVPHGPWKWCLENITRKLRVDDAILALGSEVLADLREVFCFRGCFGVEFCHWNAPGGNQGAEHGCGVHDGGGAHLQVNREPIKTCEKRLD